MEAAAREAHANAHRIRIDWKLTVHDARKEFRYRRSAKIKQSEDSAVRPIARCVLREGNLLQVGVRPLEGSGIVYMVTGSIASMIYAEPRMTLSVDLAA